MLAKGAIAVSRHFADLCAKIIHEHLRCLRRTRASSGLSERCLRNSSSFFGSFTVSSMIASIVTAWMDGTGTLSVPAHELQQRRTCGSTQSLVAIE